MEQKSKVLKKDKIDEDLSIKARLDLEESSHSSLASGKKVISEAEKGPLKKAQGIIEEAKQKALEIKTKAKNLYLQVETKMEEARLKGFEQGREQGYAKVTEELTRIQKQNQEMIGQIEKEALTLVLEISQKVIGDALKTSNEALLEMIRQALMSSMGNELILFVHPTDLERIKTQESRLMSTLQAMQTMQIKPSENVKPGGCVIESELGSIDAHLDLQISAIKHALGLSGAQEADDEDPLEE